MTGGTMGIYKKRLLFRYCYYCLSTNKSSDRAPSIKLNRGTFFLGGNI